LLTSSEEGFIDAALRAAIEVPRQAIIQSGGDVEIVTATDRSPADEVPVSSEGEGEQEETDI
jgi:hypothetical protein